MLEKLLIFEKFYLYLVIEINETLNTKVLLRTHNKISKVEECSLGGDSYNIEGTICSSDYEQIFKTLCAIVPTSDIYLYDENLNVISADGSQINKAAISTDLFIGKNLKEIINRDIFPLIESVFRNAIIGESSVREYHYCNEDFLIKTSPIFDKDRNIPIAMALIQNITSKKESENYIRYHDDEIKQINSLLERKNLELEESNSKLRKSEERLKETNAAKDKFFSLIAHDLRSPFSGFLTLSEYISNYSQIISKEELHDIATEMYRSAENVFRLIENLLHWSRLQTGNFKIHSTQFNLKHLIEHNIELFKNKAEEKNLSIINTFSPDIIVSTDVNMLDTVIRNILSNSIKFSEDGGIIKIKSFKENDLVFLSIVDSGVGMTPEFVASLFKLENHVSTDGTRNEKGTGLGLLLCKEFIEKLGGKLYIESTIGKGSHFKVSIPDLIKQELI